VLVRAPELSFLPVHLLRREKHPGGTGKIECLHFFCSLEYKKSPALRRNRVYTDTEVRHAELSKRLNNDIWFCDPHAPWQRGSNENTDDPLRQFLPKGIDLSTASQTQLNDIARLLNGRPQKTLGRATPEEALAKEIPEFQSRVALDS